MPPACSDSNQLVLGARNSGDRLEELQVDRRHHGHHAAVRLRQLGQGGDFAGVRHAHLDDGDLVLRLELQQLQRHAEVIVQIALRLQNAMPRRQHVRNAFPWSWFCRPSRSRRSAACPTTGARRRPSRCSASSESSTTSRRDLDGNRVCLLLLHHCCDCAFGERSLDIVVPVKPLAANGEEQIARLKRARVDGIAAGDGGGIELASGRHEFGGARKSSAS